MTIIVGLGNPESKYFTTRHNTGFSFVDYLAQKFNLEFQNHKKTDCLLAKNEQFLLVKPQTYMNQSGVAVKKLFQFFKYVSKEANYPHLFVAFDDLDLELSNHKIQFAVGPKLHNGINSIYNELKSINFWHIRIGIDNRAGERVIPPEVYVLQNLTQEENQILQTSFEAIFVKLKEHYDLF